MTEGKPILSGRLRSAVGKFGHWNRACAVLLLCAAMPLALPGQTLTTLVNFTGDNGSSPGYGVMQAADGNFYGTTESGPYGGGTIFRMTPSGTLTTIYGFCIPYTGYCSLAGAAGLIQAADGNFYGITNSATTDPGTVFRITPQGTLTTLYSFCSQAACADGADPNVTPLAKNWTLVTVPALTTALAVMTTLAGAAKTSPLTGLVILTAGAGGGPNGPPI